MHGRAHNCGGLDCGAGSPPIFVFITTSTVTQWAASLSHSARGEKPLKYPRLISAGELGGTLRVQSQRHPLGSGCSLLKKEHTPIPIQLKIPVKSLDELHAAVVIWEKLNSMFYPEILEVSLDHKANTWLICIGFSPCIALLFQVCWHTLISPLPSWLICDEDVFARREAVPLWKRPCQVRQEGKQYLNTSCLSFTCPPTM